MSEDVFDPDHISKDVLRLMAQYAHTCRWGGSEAGPPATAEKFRIRVQQLGHSLKYAEDAEKHVSRPFVEAWKRNHR
jgi:hypothetical protein